MPTARLTIQEYAARHELTVRQMQNHVAAGIPHTRQKNRHGGRPRIYMDPVHADAWLAQRGIITKGMVASAAQKAAGVEVPPDKEADKMVGIDRKLMREFGLMGALERFRYLEAVASSRLTRLIQEKATPIEISTCQRHIAGIVAQLRQLEMAVLEYQDKATLLLPSEQVTAAGLRIAQRVRSALASVGHNCVPRLAQHIRSHDDYASVQDIIDNSIRDALRTLPANVLTP